ncbi:preprotein translocase subunit SecE [Patescibacteria group bacterium]
MRAATNYLREVRTELTKVVWPSRNEVAKLTLIVVIISVLVATYVGLLDYAFVQLLEKII